MTTAAEVIQFPQNPHLAVVKEGGVLGGKESPPGVSQDQNQNPLSGGRPRNVAWDALVEVLGYEPLTESEKSLWGRITRSLNGAGATLETLQGVAAAYRKEWPECTLTVTAIEKWYSQFLSKANTKRRAAMNVCPECKIGGGHHLIDCSTRR